MRQGWKVPTKFILDVLARSGWNTASQGYDPAMATKIQGIEGMKYGEMEFEIQRGGKFVYYQYCVSVLVLTFRRPSDIYFVRAGESTVTKGLPFTLLSLVAGWWGIPWGPIYTIQSFITNFGGGKDVTSSVAASLKAQATVPATTSPVASASPQA